MTIETTAQAQPGQGDALLRALAQWLPARAGDPPESLPQGAHEWRDGADCWVSFLRGPDNLWAVRWDQVCPGGCAGAAAEEDFEVAQAFKPRIRCEASFVPSAAHGALATLTIYGPGDDWSQALVAKWVALPGIGQELPLRPPSYAQVAALAQGGEGPGASAALHEDLSHTRWELQQARARADEFARMCGQLKAQLQLERAGRAGGQGRLASAPACAEVAGQEPPTDLSELPQWAQVNAQRIEVLARALGGAKKSRFEQPGQVFQGLEFLAGAYRAYRCGELPKADMERALEACGMRLAGSVGRSVAGEQGSDYFTTWRGRRRMFDLHLVKGGGRDERYCLRIYFFWSAEDRKVVVGWLPSHLSNSLS